LRKKGLVEFKTDNDLLYSFTLNVLQKNKFKIVYFTDNLYKNLNNKFNRDNVSTEYEEKFIKKNKNINKII
jgi:tRNA (guanine-N7-)-methyltransferase